MIARTRLSVGLAAVFLIAGTLTGCSTAEPELAPTTAEQLQTGVLGVTTAAAAGDLAGAQSALTAVQADLLTAASAGQVSAARSAKIQSAINLVGADLSSAIETAIQEAIPEPVPTPTDTPEETPTEESPPEETPRGVDKGDNEGDGKCKKKDDDCDD